MPEISVIVPVYNVENYLRDCLNSILAQTFADFELILINDGSTDSSGKICDEYAKKDKRIRVFHQQNQGQASARNFGVNQAQTKWIHFVDSDDIIHPQMLDILFSAVTNHDVEMSLACVSKSVSVEKSLEIYSPEIDSSLQIIDVSEKTLAEFFTDFRYHSVCAKLISKDIILKFPFQVGRIHEDSPVICKWFVEAGKIAYSPNVLYVYIANNNSTTRTSFSMKKLDLLWAWKQQIEFYKSINYKKMKQRLEFQFFTSAAKFYKTLINENRKIAKKLKRYTFKNYFVVLFYSQIPLNDRLYSLEFFYPKSLRIYWSLHNRISKLTNRRA